MPGQATAGETGNGAVAGAGGQIVVGGHHDDARGRVLAGRVGGVVVRAVVARRPHGHDAVGGQGALKLRGGRVGVEGAASARPVGVVAHLDRRAAGTRVL